LFEAGALPAPVQQDDAEPHLAKDDGIDRNLTLAAPKPIDQRGIRCRLGWFAENVGVDQIASQSVSGLGIDGNKEALRRTRQQPLDYTFIWCRRAAPKPILAATDPLDLELLPGFNAILLSQRRG
jgi:hypothetical protein